MVKQGYISKHIVLTSFPNSSKPAYGIILIDDENISDIILIDESISVSSVIQKYSDWNPEDLSDYYISPGIIDLSTRIEWETYSELTKSAISGGVTFVLTESGYYNENLPSGDLYCDIGKIATLEISTIDNIPNLSNQGYLAIKGYLFPPHNTVQCIPSNLLPVFQEIEKTFLTFIIDPNLPDPRMLHAVSPFRLRNLADRLRNDLNETTSFSGSFPDLIEDEDEEDESESPPHPKLENRKSTMIQTRKKSSPLKKTERSNSEDIDIPEQKKSNELFLDIDVIKEDDEEHSKKYRGYHRWYTNPILDDLDKRIRHSQMSIQNLSLAEIQTYTKAGVTYFESPAGSSHPIIFPSSPLSEISSANSSVPTSPKPSLLQRRKLTAPLSLIVKPEATTKENLYCYHMANYSDMWEITGINKILEALKKSKCRVHITNVSAATSINKIRQAKENNKKLTCEIPASHLMFSSISIRESDTRFKSHPPIRNQANTNLLWDLLKIKGIDSISSNHACIHSDYKFTNGSFLKAANGMPSIGFSLQAVWTTINGPVSTHSQLEHYIVRMSKWLSLYPAEILNISRSRGSIAKGKFADLIIWKPFEKVVIDQEFSTFPQTSPFLGMELFGKIYRVCLRGKIAFNEGKFKPRGRLVMRINN